jgi:lysine-specific demethylase 3
VLPLFIAMNNLADSHKRTSISQLLNPLAVHDPSAAFSPDQLPNLSTPIGPNHVQRDQQGVPSFHPSFANGSSFNLRAANWELPQEATKQKPGNGTTARQYQPQMNSSAVFGDQHAPRMIRPRMDDSNNFAIAGQVWPPQQDIANMPYGAPVISPMYSDERTGELLGPPASSHQLIVNFAALSGDYQSHG